MSNTINKKKFSTGWLIVVACMLIQAIPFGVASNIQPQFVSYVVEENGFTLAGFSLIFTLGTFVSAIASPFIGTMFKKVNTKVIYLLGCLLSGGGFLAFSMCNQLWQFYLVAAVVQVGTAAISSIGVPLLINSWFDEVSKGKAMGLAFAGSGLGNIFLQQLVSNSLVANGASKSYMIFGVLSLIVGIPVSLFMLRMPKDDSEVVRAKNAQEEKTTTNSANSGFTFKEATKLKFFWMFGFGLFFLGMYVSALAVQYPAYLKGYVGISPKLVGTIGSTFALFSLFGNLVGGAIFDKLGTTKGLVVAFLLAAVSCLALIFAQNIHGLAILFATLKGSFFGQKDFGSILGVVQIFFAVGFAAGSSVFGLLVDKLGYTFAWSTIFVFIVICYVSLIVASIGMQKLNKARNNEVAKEAC